MKKIKAASFFKYFVIILLSAAVVGAFVYVCIKGDLEKSYISFGCIAACFLLSLIFINKLPKKIFLTLALACGVAANWFLMVDGSSSKQIWGIAILLGAQFFLLLYSLFLTKAIGLKIFDLALRVSACLLIYFIVPKYLTLETLDILAMMYAANFLVTILAALVHIKTEWFTFLAMLLLLLSNVCVGLANGGFDILKLSGKFVDFIINNNISFYTHIPSVLLLSLSSVFAKKKKLGM